MLNRLQFFRSVGQFDAVTGAANIPLARMTVIYAENGRGKTTIAAILRSLSTGDPNPIAERARLAAANPPQVVIDCTGGPPLAMFQNNAWNRAVGDLANFDDVFIDQNVYSGLAVEADHRQKLHELILGRQGIALNETLRACVARIEEHNRTLRTKGDAIPVAARAGLTVDNFCALDNRGEIDAEIQAAERLLAAASERDTIRNAAAFAALSLPELDVDAVNRLLARDLPALDAAAAAQVRQHLADIEPDGEAWVADGMKWVHAVPADGGPAPCPFCAQDLRGSALIGHYRAYFSAGYEELKQAITTELTALTAQHGGEAPAAFERGVRVWGERRQFWSRFSALPEVNVDTAEIARAWRAAREAVSMALAAKERAPLEPIALPADAVAAIATFNNHARAIATLNLGLQQANTDIRVVKEQAAAGNTAALTSDLQRLKAVKARHSAEIAPLCTEYLTEKAAKAATEADRDRAREALTQYRDAVFPAYQTAINQYLGRFNAQFRLDNVVSTNTAQGSSCTYNVVINNQPIAVTGAARPGAPSFRTTLSAGDRNTLALAFFFASLDRDPDLARKIVVLDDPITSLDDHRSLTTVQQIRHLMQRTAQVILLSHSKPFLCRVWEGTDQTQRAALLLTRDGTGSSIETWNVTDDCISEHDRRHTLLRDYEAAQTPNNREVAAAIRPILEVFCRVAFPKHYPPGMMVGQFRGLCDQHVGTGQEILNQANTQELRDLIEYANKFHHDTNAAWETEAINDAELLGYVSRTLAFARR
jgi:wobble nucleotide-excising tRNase